MKFTLNTQKCLVWLHRDLRLEDHSAFQLAFEHFDQAAALFILDTTDPWLAGKASSWWLYEALKDFEQLLLSKGMTLICLKGDPRELIPKVMKELKVSSLISAKVSEPHTRELFTDLEDSLRNLDSQFIQTPSHLLHDPEYLLGSKGDGLKVFTPFYLRLMKQPFRAVLSYIQSPKQFWSAKLAHTITTIDSLNLISEHPWYDKLKKVHKPTQKAANNCLKQFCLTKASDYLAKRDLLAEEATSNLSPYLAFGQLSPAQVIKEMISSLKSDDSCNILSHPFARQIIWREFANHLLWHHPTSPESALNAKFNPFPWSENEHYLAAWQSAQTGYPIVDAAMQELWQTGKMHNRARMIVGSFLVKDLLIDWRSGAKWFWDCLVDADLANNTLGWQWIAGCGVDSAPYFRIFNPTLQSKKFDPEGVYIKKWLAPLRKVTPKYLHEPIRSQKDLHLEGFELEKDYYMPIVDHQEARKKALEAYDFIKEGRGK